MLYYNVLKLTFCFTLFQAKIRIMFIDAIVLAQFAIQGKCVTFGAQVQVQAAVCVETGDVATPLIAK